MYILLNFESFKIMIHIIPTKKFSLKKNSDLKQHYTVISLKKSSKDF